MDQHKDSTMNESTNKTKEVSKQSKNPVTKKCRQCKQLKIISEFGEFDLSLKTKDHRSVTCNSCIDKMEVEEEEEGHTAGCINEKFMNAVFAQLETLLALSENGVDVPSEILNLMAAIFEQDERNLKD